MRSFPPSSSSARGRPTEVHAAVPRAVRAHTRTVSAQDVRKQRGGGGTSPDVPVFKYAEGEERHG